MALKKSNGSCLMLKINKMVKLVSFIRCKDKTKVVGFSLKGTRKKLHNKYVVFQLKLMNTSHILTYFPHLNEYSKALFLPMCIIYVGKE